MEDLSFCSRFNRFHLGNVYWHIVMGRDLMGLGLRQRKVHCGHLKFCLRKG
jgi:hypothetical protein